MLFFKPKVKDKEILPLPPSSPTSQLSEKPKSFDEIIKTKKPETFPEEEKFSGLVNELEEPKPKKMISKKEKIPKKAKTAKKQKILEKTKLKQLKKIPLKTKLTEFEKDFNLDKVEKEFEEAKMKPKEILEAEEEIKNAIEKIKGWNASERSETRSQLSEKPSFFKKFFVKKKVEVKPAKESLSPTIRDLDEVSIIRNKIDDARQALMRFDLETAKKDYIEIIKIYNNIKPEDKAKVYRDINELYSERKSAEELKS